MYYLEDPGLLDIVYEKTDSDEFAILTLLDIFHLSEDQSYEKIKELHKYGKAIIGTYSRDIAETYEKKLVMLAYLEKKIIIFKIRKNVTTIQ